jgi:hypothetical protein
MVVRHDCLGHMTFRTRKENVLETKRWRVLCICLRTTSLSLVLRLPGSLTTRSDNPCPGFPSRQSVRATQTNLAVTTDLLCRIKPPVGSRLMAFAANPTHQFVHRYRLIVTSVSQHPPHTCPTTSPPSAPSSPSSSFLNFRPLHQPTPVSSGDKRPFGPFSTHHYLCPPEVQKFSTTNFTPNRSPTFLVTYSSNSITTPTQQRST